MTTPDLFATKYVQLLLLCLSCALAIFSNTSQAISTGKVCFGRNFAKPASEHTNRLHLTINDSEKLYFNDLTNQIVMSNMNTQGQHTVKVFFDEKLAQSWMLDFSRLDTETVVIWRSAGAWRTEAATDENCTLNW